MLLYNTDDTKNMGSICKWLQMLPIVFEGMKESDFLLLFVGCVFLELLQILTG